MWFLYILLLMTAGYTLWRQVTKRDSLRRFIPKEFPIPRHAYLLLLAIGLGGVTFLIRLVSPIDDFPLGIPFGFIIQYVMMFSVGVIAVRYAWFDKMNRSRVRAWSLTLAATTVLFYLYGFLFLGMDGDLSVVLGGPTVHALVFAVVDNVVCMCMIFVLIPLFRNRYNSQGPVVRNLSTSAFHMYLLHPLILIPISLGFASIPLFPVLKLAIVFPLSVLLCYVASHYVIQRMDLRRLTRVALSREDDGQQ
jgi:surface polysaccharide O-acyltransferase-like enzyme